MTDAAIAAILRDLPIISTSRSAPPTGVNPDTGEMGATVPNLPAEFYVARPQLAHIRQAAHSRSRSADAVLGVALARIAAATPPSLQLPPVVGAIATLDLAIATVGPSGTGKSSTARLAGELLPINDEDVAVLPLGSGEGIVEAYMGDVDEPDENDKTRRVRRQVRRGLLAMLDEGQALGELGHRKGSTLLPTIRSAWSGDRLGQANASADRRRHLPPGTYRFALVAGFQLEHATVLLDDVASGTPQRFLFLAATDPSIPDQAPEWPGPLKWQPPVHQTGPLGLDRAIHDEIRHRALRRTRGEEHIDQLDAHRDLSRLKVAGLLAILDRRTDIQPDDWELAGLVLDASDRVRTSIQTAAAWRAQMAERTTTGRLARRAAALDDDAGDRALGSMARSIARHVGKAKCEGGCTRRCVTHSTASKHRDLATVDDAIEQAEREGWIVVDGPAIRPGESRP